MKRISFALALFCFFGEPSQGCSMSWFEKKEKSAPQEKQKEKEEEENSLAEDFEDDSILAGSPAQYAYWRFHKHGALGYRRDRQRFIELQPGTASFVKSVTRYRSRDTIQLNGVAHIEWNRLVFDLGGGFGWLVFGKADYSDLENALKFKDLKIKAGYTADLGGSLGIRLKMIDEVSFGFSFLPALGFQYSHIQNVIKGGKEIALFGGRTATIQFPNPNQQDWYSPYAMGTFEFRFAEKFVFLLFCQAHLPILRSTSKMAITTNGVSGSDLSSSVLQTTNSFIKGKNMQGYLGGFDMKYHGKTGWTFGAHFEGSATWSTRSLMRNKTVTETFFPSPVTTSFSQSESRAKLHWTEYNVYFFAGYKF